MSTKIYYGAKLIKPMSNKELLDWCTSMREEILPLRREYLDKLICNKLYLDADNLFMKDGKIDISDVAYESNNIFREMFNNAKNKSIREPFVDFDFTIIIFPNGLCMPFMDNDIVRKVWRKQFDAGIVEDYGYWDNTDPDENCTEEQWKKRYDDWCEALHPNMDGVPCYTGISIDVVSIPYWGSIVYKEINKHRKTKQERAGVWAGNKILFELMEDLAKKENISKDEKANHIFRYLREAKDMMNFPEHKKEFDKLYKECLNKIPDSYFESGK